tara:strand:- start:4631 stop:5191 length:561 start_codon:yes stop_codon:yes gene_type:complete
MNCTSNFLNNQQLAKQAGTFDQYYSYRSPFDQQFLSVYDPLSINAQSGPMPTVVEGFCHKCGDYDTNLNTLSGYSPCMTCGSYGRSMQSRSVFDSEFNYNYYNLAQSADTRFAPGDFQGGAVPPGPVWRAGGPLKQVQPWGGQRQMPQPTPHRQMPQPTPHRQMPQPAGNTGIPIKNIKTGQLTNL